MSGDRGHMLTGDLSPAQFQKLQREWYKKLKDGGFNDIEPEPDTPFLKEHHLRTRRRVRKGWNGGQKLYELLALYLNTGHCGKRSERMNAALYVAGLSPGKISKRSGATARSVQKQIQGIVSRVKEAYAAQETFEYPEDDEAEDGAEAGQDAGDSAGPSPFPFPVPGSDPAP